MRHFVIQVYLPTVSRAGLPGQFGKPAGTWRITAIARHILNQRRRRDEAQVLTFHTKAWSSFAPPTCRMPDRFVADSALGQYQGIPRAINER
jgi:hypothetical protein